MQPEDSARVARLVTDFDGSLITTFLVDAYTAITAGAVEETLGVVVEAAGVGDLVGMGTVRFARAQFNGEVLPLAFLDGLKVHKDFRRQGLGYQIAAWRIEQARQRYGNQCLIATGMLQENHASRAVAQKWCREFIDSALNVLILPVHWRKPRLPAGIRVVEIQPAQFEEFAHHQNHFYQDRNLYPPLDPASIAQTLAVSAGGRQPYRYYAALDRSGSLLAGAQTWARGLLKSDQLVQPPARLRLLNRAFPAVPPDFTIHSLNLTGLWYLARAEDAARSLLETIRWECRSQGTTLEAAFDARDPDQKLLNARPWHQPRPVITLAFHGPAPIERSRLLYAPGRV
jgi:GNAT superfamily N-acetyltransferase